MTTFSPSISLDHDEDTTMTDISDTELLQIIETTDHLATTATQIVQLDDDFSTTIEGTGECIEDTYLAAIHLAPGAGVVRIIIAAADDAEVRRVVLDDGRIAYDFEPEQDTGVTVSVGTLCPLCAHYLRFALDDAADALDLLLPDEQEGAAAA